MENLGWDLQHKENGFEASPSELDNISLILNDLKNNNMTVSVGVPIEFLKVSEPSQVEGLGTCMNLKFLLIIKK